MPSPRPTSVLALLWTVAITGCGGCPSEDTPVSVVTPALATSVNAIGFGSVFVGAVDVLEFDLLSVGTAAVTVSALEVEGVGLTLRSTPPGRLVPGASAPVVLSFAPGGPVPINGRVVIHHDSTPNAQTVVDVRGRGQLPLDCDDGNPCTDNIFDLDTESCVTINLNTACDDENACTEQDRCADGACVGQALSCPDDGIPCTLEVCDPNQGCTVIPRDELCADNDRCTDDLCVEGEGCVFQAKPDFSPCGEVIDCVSVELCLQQQCRVVSIPEGTPCDDVDVCTTGDECREGSCQGARTQGPPALLGENRIFPLRSRVRQERDTNGPVSLSDGTFLLPTFEGLARLSVAPGLFPQPSEVIQLDTLFENVLPDQERIRKLATLADDRLLVAHGLGSVSLFSMATDTPPTLINTVAGTGTGLQTFAPDLIVRCSTSTTDLEFIDITPQGLGVPREVPIPVICDAQSSVVVTANHVVVVQTNVMFDFPRSGDSLNLTAARTIPFPDGDGLFETRVAADASTDFFLVGGSTPASGTLRLSSFDLTRAADSIRVGNLVNAAVFVSTFFVQGDAVYLGGNGVFRTNRTLDAELERLITDATLPAFDEVYGHLFVGFDSFGADVVAIENGVATLRPILATNPITRLLPAPDGVWANGPAALSRMTEDDILNGIHPSVFAAPFFPSNQLSFLDLPTGVAGGVGTLLSIQSNDHYVGHCARAPCAPDLGPTNAFSISASLISYDDVGQIGILEQSNFNLENFIYNNGVFPNADGGRIFVHAINIEECLVTFLVTPDAEDFAQIALVVGDRCTANTRVAFLSAVSMPDFYTADLVTHAAQLKDQGDGILTAAIQNHVFVIDIANPLLPVVLSQVGTPNVLEDDDALPVDIARQWANVDVAFDGSLLALALTSNLDVVGMEDKDMLAVSPIVGPTIPRIIDLVGRDENAEADPLLTARERPRRRILALEFPRVYVGTTTHIDGQVRDVVRGFTLDTSELELDVEFVLPSEPTGALVIEDKLFVARADGVSLISPPCAAPE